MITPTLFSGLLTLSGPQVNALDELAQAVPELFAMPVQDLRSICTSLKRIEQAQVELEEAASPKVTVQTREALLSARWLLGCRPDCCCKLNRALKAIDAREGA